MSLRISGVKNPYFVNPSLATSVKIYTYNPDQTGVIDQILSGLIFTPLITARTISDASLVRNGDMVGQLCTYEFTYTPTVDYLSGSDIMLIAPNSAIYNSDIGSVLTCTNTGSSFGNSNIPNCSIYTNNLDTSISTISIKNMCLTGCIKNQKLKILISNIQNPNTIAILPNTFKISAYTSNGYLIEQGNLNFAGLGNLQTNTISGISIIRSNNNIKSSMTMNLSFNYKTLISSSGVIEIDFPLNMVVVQTTFRVYRFSDNAELTAATTIDLSSGSVTHLTINNYCSLSCPKDGSIKIAMAGIKNMDYVISILGSILIYTSDKGSKSDQGSVANVATVLAPFMAGSLTNIEIRPFNPTISATTNYRVIFTSQNSIPAGAILSLKVPSGISLSSTDTKCKFYINTNTALSCAVTGDVVTVSNGFSTQLIGPVMIGF